MKRLVIYGLLIVVGLALGTDSRLKGQILKNGEPVSVILGEPQIWTLEQAHYLLARIRDRNFGIRAKDLAQLDPNESAARRIEALQSALTVNTGFSQATALENEQALRKFRHDRQVYEEAQARLGEFEDELLQIERDLIDTKADLAELRAQQSNLRPRAGRYQDDLADQIAAKEADKMRLEERKDLVEGKITDLKAAQAPSLGTLTDMPISTAANSALTNGALESLLTAQNGAQFESKLDASTRLENHIQMQYEILAKQLSLLRDEVGPHQRLIFLELPHSIYSVAKKSNNHLVQSQWQLKGYWQEDLYREMKRVLHEQLMGSKRLATSKHKALEASLEQVREYPRLVTADDWLIEIRRIFREENAEDVFSDFARAVRNRPLPSTEKLRECLAKANNPQAWPQVTCGGATYTYQFSESPRDRKMRNVDLIPRNSALNVTDIYQTRRGLALGSKLAWLFLGTDVAFQRLKESYGEFLQQEVFAAAWGKGTDTFGWTFGPRPGTKSVQSGMKSTYAVAVLPESAVAVEIGGQAFSFKRNAQRPGNAVQSSVNFLSVIPDSNESFYVREVEYTPVEAGSPLTLTLRGTFSRQVGILVEGQALQRVLSISGVLQDVSRQSSGLPQPGVFEWVSSSELAAVIQLSSDFVGTPDITLVSPQKVSSINYYGNLLINNSVWKSLQDNSKTHPMFFRPVSIESVQVIENACGLLRLGIKGEGFRASSKPGIHDLIRIGARSYSPKGTPSDNWVEVEVRNPYPTGETWLIQVERQETRQSRILASKTIANPVVFNGKLESTWIVPGKTISIQGSNFPTCPLGHVEAYFLCPKSAKVKGGVEALSPHEILVTSPQDVSGCDWVKLSSRTAKALVDLRPPSPTITRLLGPSGKAEGSVGETLEVAIIGDHLEGVSEVYFGNIKATLKNKGSRTRLVVVVESDEEGHKTVLAKAPAANGFRENGADFSRADPPLFKFVPKPEEKDKGKKADEDG